MEIIETFKNIIKHSKNKDIILEKIPLNEIFLCSEGAYKPLSQQDGFEFISPDGIEVFQGLKAMGRIRGRGVFVSNHVEDHTLLWIKK